jgi:hypothetical protein
MTASGFERSQPIFVNELDAAAGRRFGIVLLPGPTGWSDCLKKIILKDV